MMQRTFVFEGAVAVCAFVLAAAAPSQAVATNTTLVTSLSLSGAPQVYGVTGFESGGSKFAVLCRGGDGLEVVNMSTIPPTLAGHIPPVPGSASVRDAVVVGNVVYAVQNGGSILKINLGLNGAPTFDSTFGNASDGCAFASGLLLIARGAAGGGGAFEIWNVATTPPSMVYTYDNGAAFLCRDVVASNGRAYVFNQVSTTNFSTFVFDIGIGSNASILGSFVGGGQAGAVYRPTGGGTTILACTTPSSSGLFQTWDVTNPAAASLLATYQTSTTTAARNVAIAGGRYAAVAYYSDGLRILDLGNPAAPEVAGIYDPYPSNIGLPATQGFFDVYAESATRFYVSQTITQQGFLQGVHAIDFTPSPVPLRLNLSFLSDGTFYMVVTGAGPSAPIFNLASIQTSTPFGSGSFLGIGADAFNLLLSFQIPPFVDVATATGSYAFGVPAGGIAPGTSFHIRSVTLDATAYRLSEIGSVVF